MWIPDRQRDQECGEQTDRQTEGPGAARFMVWIPDRQRDQECGPQADRQRNQELA